MILRCSYFSSSALDDLSHHLKEVLEANAFKLPSKITSEVEETEHKAEKIQELLDSIKNEPDLRMSSCLLCSF